MFNLLPLSQANGRQINRRDLLRLGALGVMGSRLSVNAGTTLQQIDHRPTAKHCIYIFLCGGPSQLDMWDLKPNAPDQIRGPFKPIQTNVPGIQIGELLPQVAQQADKFAVIRSMQHDSTVHDIGILYTLLADTTPPTKRAYPPTRNDHPGLGGILRTLLGNTPEVPAWVTVPRPFTTGSRFYKGQTAGFLGPTCDPFFMNESKRDSLADKEFKIQALQPIEGVDPGRLSGRKDLLDQLDQLVGKTRTTDQTNSMHTNYEKVFSMLSSDGVRRAFDLNHEQSALRDRYGRNEYGQSFLLARRLVEAGVRMINVFWTFYGTDGCQFNLWDNHGSDKEVCGGYNKGVEMIKAPYCCPSFDTAYSALLQDLDQRGLLNETLVVVVGEFGRTPKINKNAGRDHWPSCYSSVLAGGGVRGGQIYGASDDQAAYVKHLPVTPDDLGATVLHTFGYSPETPIYDPTDRPVRISKGQPVTQLF